MNQDIFKKRLIYKSANRGWKETDILLGQFTKENITFMNDAQLNMLDVLLDQPDAELFNWITKKSKVPKQYDNEIMQMLQEFRCHND